ncbi:MAG TPA: hypothetical protein VGH63_10130, partial [Polyangia bacterium]
MDDRAARRLAFAVPVIAGLVVYLNALGNGFVLDDYHFIVENAAVRRLSLAVFAHATQTAGGAFYRPLAVSSFALEHALFGMAPGVFHLCSVAYHLAATALVVALALRVAGPRVALMAGVLFAVHPVHTEAVTGLANRPETMATALYVAALVVEASPLRRRWRVLAENALFLA